MNDQQERERLFTLLRQALKAKKLTYADLATWLGISELSVKRLFRDKDCKMSRILEICALLNMTLADLFEMNARTIRQPQYLSEAIEAALAADPDLFTLFIFLVSQLELPLIQRLSDLDQPQFYLALRKLEQLGLIELVQPSLHFRFLVPLPIRWRLQGPLGKILRKVNQNYLGYCFDRADHPDHLFNSTSRLMSADSAQKIQAQLLAIRREFDSLSTQDQMFFQEQELGLCKIVMAMGPFPVQDMLPFKK